ncbi:MAG TPA: fumarylacetoacetate hydrolase family protein [Candidatus Binatia bacterium]|nr:fumarylacetoacetate hydrolase family protein [Candidatus Binatia bacterium]
MSFRDDPRIARGMAAQLARFHALLAAGHPRVGWKVGFNAPAVQRALGLDGIVVGHLTLATALEPGRPHALAGGTDVRVEPEIAIHLGAAVPPGAPPDAIRAAIIGLGPALEVLDLDRPLDDLESLLAANVLHRAVLFGATDPRRAGGGIADLDARFVRNGVEVARTSAVAALGDVAAIVGAVADRLAPFGEGLRAGDRIISGALVAPVAVAPGDRIAVDLGPLGTLGLAFSA